jgi:transposase
MDTTATPPKAILGIDVSKAKLDCHLIPDETVLVTASGRRTHSRSLVQAKAYRKTVANTASGIQHLVEWMKGKQVELAHVCIEPTSFYHELVFETLSADHWVSAINTRAVHRFAEALELINKTDTLDAMVIAEFCRAQRPSASRPLTPSERELRDLTRHRTALVQQAQKEALRLESVRSKSCRMSIQRVLKALANEQTKIEAAIQEHIRLDATLRQQAKLYQSVKGVGPIVSATVLAEMPDLPHFDSARQAAAYLGLVPRKSQSGSSLNRSGGITKRGNTRLRAILYMAALTAMKRDPVVRAFADRIRGPHNAKKPKVVIVAVMRKLVHILYGIAKSGQPRRLPAII